MSYQCDLYPTKEQVEKVGIRKIGNGFIKKQEYNSIKDCAYLYSCYSDKTSQYKDELILTAELCLVDCSNFFNYSNENKTNSTGEKISMLNKYNNSIKMYMSAIYTETYYDAINGLYDRFIKSYDEKSNLCHFDCGRLDEDYFEIENIENFCEINKYDISSLIIKYLDNSFNKDIDLKYTDFLNDLKQLIDDFIEEIDYKIRNGLLIELKNEGCLFLDDYNFETISNEDKAKIDEYNNNNKGKEEV